MDPPQNRDQLLNTDCRRETVWCVMEPTADTTVIRAAQTAPHANHNRDPFVRLFMTPGIRIAFVGISAPYTLPRPMRSIPDDT